MSKLDILAIGAHPDDIELSCSGTLFKAAAQGKTIGLVDLTRGELGTRGTAEIRTQEAISAAEILGAVVRENIDLEDGFFQEDRDQLVKLIHIIRKYQPDIVLANATEDRHPDHGRGASFISRACFLSGLIKIETSDDGALQDRWRPKTVYHYIQDYNLKPDFVVDISDFMDNKMEVISAFKSQFYDPESKELDSPISGKSFKEFILAKARTYGRYIGVEYGEGFNVARPIGVEDLFDLR